MKKNRIGFSPNLNLHPDNGSRDCDGTANIAIYSISRGPLRFGEGRRIFIFNDR